MILFTMPSLTDLLITLGIGLAAGLIASFIMNTTDLTTMNRILVSTLLALASVAAAAQSLPLKEIAPQPKCVHIDRAGLHFPGSREAQDRFYSLLDSLIHGDGRNGVA